MKISYILASIALASGHEHSSVITSAGGTVRGANRVLSHIPKGDNSNPIPNTCAAFAQIATTTEDGCGDDESMANACWRCQIGFGFPYTGELAQDFKAGECDSLTAQYLGASLRSVPDELKQGPGCLPYLFAFCNAAGVAGVCEVEEQ